MAKSFALTCWFLLCSASINVIQAKREIRIDESSSLNLENSNFKIKTLIKNNISDVFITSGDLDQLVDLWNPMSMIPEWKIRNFKDLKISWKCQQDMSWFLQGLAEGKPWAVKSKLNRLPLLLFNNIYRVNYIHCFASSCNNFLT